MKEFNLHKVVKAHTSDYPNPISLKKGDQIVVGPLYKENPNWTNWVFCHKNELISGWVPRQIIRINGEKGIVLEDYVAKELNVQVGEHVLKERDLNGWLWVKRVNNSERGWIPKENVELIN